MYPLPKGKVRRTMNDEWTTSFMLGATTTRAVTQPIFSTRGLGIGPPALVT